MEAAAAAEEETEEEAEDMARMLLPSRWLCDRADVYTPDAATGAYTVLARAALPCRVGLAGAPAGRTPPERAEPRDLRRLVWLEAYALPEPCEVVVGATRYRPAPNTAVTARGPQGELICHAVDLVQVEP